MGKVDDLKTIEGTRAEKLKVVAEIATDRNVYGWMTPDALVSTHHDYIDTGGLSTHERILSLTPIDL